MRLNRSNYINQVKKKEGEKYKQQSLFTKELRELIFVCFMHCLVEFSR